jgi:exoribonuclease-2
MKTGQIVFVYRDSTMAVGRIVGSFGGKFEVEFDTNARQTFAERRLARLSDRVVADAPCLDEYIAEISGLRDSICLEDVWSLLQEEEASSFSLTTLTEWAFPHAGVSAQDALFWALHQDRLYFKRGKDGRYTKHSAVSIDERKRQQAKELAEIEEMAAMAAWLRTPTNPPTEAGEKVIAALKDLVLYDQEGTLSAKARALIRERWPRNSVADIKIAWQTLVQEGVWSPNENLEVVRAALPTTFSDEVQREATLLSQASPKRAGRTDYCHLRTIAIDDERTTEVDDALAVEVSETGERTVYVFIADAAAWVPHGSGVDAAAKRRIATVYLPEGKLPMLPSVLGQGCATLCEGAERLALAFIMTLSEQGTIIGFRIEEAIIQLTARLTYEQVEDIIGGQDHALADDVRALNQMATGFYKTRLNDGALVLDRQEVIVHVKPDGEITVETYWTGKESHRLVSEWMVATCAQTAAWCRQQSIPAIYRGQDAPTGKITIPADRPLSLTELNEALRMMRGAFLTAEPRSHAGLGLPCYTQVTSPLRRYIDLVMQHQIHHVLQTGQPLFSQGTLNEICCLLEQTVRSIARTERATRRYWLLKSLESRCGERVEVEIVREIGRRFLVQFLENGLRTIWSPTSRAVVGARVQVSLEAVDARWDRLVVV